MATITKLSSGSWRVQVRRKGRYASESFKRLRDAQEWAIDIERSIDRGSLTKARSKGPVRSFGDVIDLHRQDMLDVGRPPRRSKAAFMEALKASLGAVRLADLDRERLIDFGKRRAKGGAGPATLAVDFSFIRTLLTHAAAVHGVDVSAEQVRLARVALTRLGMSGS